MAVRVAKRSTGKRTSAPKVTRSPKRSTGTRAAPKIKTTGPVRRTARFGPSRRPTQTASSGRVAPAQGRPRVRAPKAQQRKLTRKLEKAVRRSTRITGPLSAEQKRFAASFAKASGLSPRVAAAAVLREGGNNTPGDNNWLNIGWTDSGQADITADPVWQNPASAGRATGKWIKGKWGQQYDYVAADTIQAIPKARGDQAQMQAWANSGWASSGASPADTYNQVGASTKRIPKKLVRRSRRVLGSKKTKQILKGGGSGETVNQKGGPWGGSQRAVLSAIPKQFRSEGKGDKRTPEENSAVGGSSSSDHLTTNEAAYAADLPADDKLAQRIASKLGMASHTGTNEVVKGGYRYQLIWQDAGHYDHIHLGATWVGKGQPPGVLGGSTAGAAPSSTASTGATAPAANTPAGTATQRTTRRSGKPRRASQSKSKSRSRRTPDPLSGFEFSFEPYSEETKKRKPTLGLS